MLCVSKCGWCQSPAATAAAAAADAPAAAAAASAATAPAAAAPAAAATVASPYSCSENAMCVNASEAFLNCVVIQTIV